MSATSPYLLKRRAAGPLRTAHRGAPRLAPDNTLESIVAAARFDVDFVEVDVHLTRDGQVLLWHDEQFIMPEGAYEIARHSLAELRALKVPDGTLATLPEAIEAVQGRAGLMIDLKAPELHDEIEQALRSAAFTDVLVCGGYDGTLRRLKAALPDIAVSRTPDAAYHQELSHRLKAEAYLDAVTVYWRTVGPELIAAAQQAGVLVLAWTVDHPHLAQQVLEAGADGITSNDVALLVTLSKKLASRPFLSDSSR
ncbi:glycerophosphodiester phosphodiesterase family protein [Deinococcus rubellus]|uniref:Glycerophosphodiester phosphodiesterase n=1 Tax=Deinococcus rubellus TaxID=1889240 RepID=A0ABY5YI54_9DEIO|nr:glycerophosphodiester phosphodiesterase [Deinococcus rubellus]UWX64805.1 glycerophosphodiester phosphodiesterase [Deinococcus rubellus]